MYIVFSSGGNDSVALLQFALNKRLENIHVVYQDTGWASQDWGKRISKLSSFCLDNGVTFHILKSEGMVNLVRRKKGFPAGGRMAQFCTAELKIKPAIEWMEKFDPQKEATCLTGVRREESRERMDAPEHVESSERHGGRELWQPLVRTLESQRDQLIKSAGFEVLPHRSQECSPCINANINDLRALSEFEISRLEQLENEMGFTSKGKPRVMFRPARHKGAVGIRDVVGWANIPRSRDQIGLFDLTVGSGCSSGFCGY